MRPVRTILSTALAVLFAATAGAQQPAGNVSQVIRQKAAPGMTDKYEAGRKKHMDWHRKMNDAWTWDVWQLTTGPDTGSYIVHTGNHQWQDFDTWNEKMGAGDTADAQVSMVPYAGGSTTSYWVVLRDHSRLPPAGAQYPMATIATYHVKPGAGTAFLDAIKKINESLAKAGGFPPAIWYALANGGEGGSYAVVTLRKNMAEMAPPSPSMREVAEKHMGKDGADATWKAFFDSVRYSTTEMMEYRTDLSYRPAAR